MTPSLELLTNQMLPKIEHELREVISLSDTPETTELHAMIAYHMGWNDRGSGTKASGKRIRPLLVLLTTAAAGGNWQHALPAAAAIELVHNFSLIHDDIEDNSPLRRGRPTLWRRWGIPQAINCGDTVFTLGTLAILRLVDRCSSQVVLDATKTLKETCLELTQGQYLDLAYEKRQDLTIEHYMKMIHGKTASLIGACTRIGGIIAEREPKILDTYHQFGLSLGLAFQMQDDLLGIWGDQQQTGKSTESDIVSGKKTIPILYGLNQGGKFAERWNAGPIKPGEEAEIATLLEHTGAKDYTQERVGYFTQQAIHYLQTAQPDDGYSQALNELAYMLLNRTV